MVSKDEIKRVFDELTAAIESDQDYWGDNFQYGVIVGKAIALGWTIGKLGGCDADSFTFKDWVDEQKIAGREFPYLKDFAAAG